VQAGGLPDEVAPMVRALNAMLERLAHAFDSQRAFVADAAHELRSPLTALKLQAQLVRRAPDDAARAAAIDALVAGVDRATRLVEQLLTLARQEPGAAAVPLQTVVLAPLARQVLADAAPLAQARGSTLELQADEQATALGDSAALAVLLRNLVDNALRHGADAAEPPSVTLTSDAGTVTLVVRDHGPGVPEEQLAHLAQAFYRPDSARTRAAGGVGLGLYLCRLVAQAHGGSFSVRNAQPGLAVTVTLPPG
jgi:signal transduction histidine kinase